MELIALLVVLGAIGAIWSMSVEEPHWGHGGILAFAGICLLMALLVIIARVT